MPYSGSAGAVRDLVGGHVSAMFLPLHTALPLVADKQIRLLAIGGSRAVGAGAGHARSKSRASPASMSISGMTLAPAGTSAEIVARYNSEINAILAQASVRDALAKQGMQRAGNPGAACGNDGQRSAALVQGGQGCRHLAQSDSTRRDRFSIVG